MYRVYVDKQKSYKRTLLVGRGLIVVFVWGPGVRAPTLVVSSSLTYGAAAATAAQLAVYDTFRRPQSCAHSTVEAFA